MTSRDQPPPEYGPPRRYLACLVCRERIEGPAEPVCSDACWLAVRDHLGVDKIPDGLSRNQQIERLVSKGKRLAWVSAWYGLSPGTVKNLVRGAERSGLVRTDSRLGPGAGWLDKPPPSDEPARLPSRAGPPPRYIRCVICTKYVDVPSDARTSVQPICSERCRKTLRKRLGVDALPEDIGRDDAIGTLADKGHTFREIGAWYRLSASRIRMIAHEKAPDADDTSDTGSAAQTRVRGWLDR